MPVPRLMVNTLLDHIAHTMYVDAVYCYRPSSMVCRSVTLVSPAKTAETIEMPFGFTAQVGAGNHVLDGVQTFPSEEVIFGERRAHCKCRDFLP